MDKASWPKVFCLVHLHLIVLLQTMARFLALLFMLVPLALLFMLVPLALLFMLVPRAAALWKRRPRVSSILARRKRMRLSSFSYRCLI
jgi:hypothetical protein